MNTVVKPLHDWKRHYPTAKRIAAELLAEPALLELRTRYLQPAITTRFGVHASTARTAVAFARKAIHNRSTP